MSSVNVIALLRHGMAKMTEQRELANPGQRLRLLWAWVGHRRQFADMAGTASPALQHVASERPQALVGPLIWPYLCAAWGTSERLARIAAHYRIVDRLGPPFPFAMDEVLVLADLDHTMPGLRIVLDQPRWFIREGGLTLNLFVDDFRAYSLAFSFSDTPASEAPDGQGIDCLIGSVQGRNIDEAPELYRNLTKAAHGLRPRDLLIEICRILCRHWGVRRLLGIRDSQRHHRHPFFRGKTIAPQDYDTIWEDRGGKLADDSFYRLPIESERRNDDEIKPNKRSLYRRRYRFLDRLEDEIPAGLPVVRPTRFDDR